MGLAMSSDAKPGMVIVGAGECGGRAAITLRELGWHGAISLIGNEPHPPYERPPLSKAFLTSDPPLGFSGNGDAPRLAELAINHLAGRTAQSIDRERQCIRLDDETALPYHRLLLATGCHARRLSIPGSDSALPLRSFSDAMILRKYLAPGRRIVIIGGGFIGLELAASARQRGASVTVIENQQRLLSRNVPATAASFLERRHLEAGVVFRLGTGVVAIESGKGGYSVALDSGEQVQGDIVIAGVGASPNTSLADDAGLQVGNGISVDEFLQTSDPAILAAGDCAAATHPLFDGRRIRLESWRNAHEQGVLAAHNMIGHTSTQTAVPWFWSDQYELCLQVAGMPYMGSTIVERKIGDGAFLAFHLDDRGRLVGTSALGQLGAIAKEMRISEILISRQACLDRAILADSTVHLKTLLRD